ncbi:MAG: polysaccharide deacetylase family protein [Xanthobacteraceae bacterium]|jgi:peptidoglycan/xylan/chitin deacetylase (PgdA/CDA1 family)|nr:polysaccharide deacetylase family protein [Xanthobacteraceae bacterium]
MKPAPYGPFKFSLIDQRPKLSWPNDARVALWVITNIEFFALDRAMPGDSNERPKGNEGTPQVRHWSQRDYGNRVGIVRLMNLLKKYDIRSTVALNSDVCDVHPEIVQACMELDWEFIGHNRTNTARLNEIPLDEERATIRHVLDRIGQATKKRPVGWLGSGLQETWNTLDHLIDEGCTYVADWVNDDQPYTMTVDGKSIVSVPYSYELNDMAAVVRSKSTPGEFERMIKDQFDVLYAEGEASGRVMAIALHPFIMGQPHRIAALERALKYICSFAGVWKATGSEIASHYQRSGVTF